MSAKSDPRRSPTSGADSQYWYRRPLGARELLPAVGVGIGVGLMAFYVARILLARTPLVVNRERLPARRAAMATSPASDRGRG